MSLSKVPSDWLISKPSGHFIYFAFSGAFGIPECTILLEILQTWLWGDHSHLVFFLLLCSPRFHGARTPRNPDMLVLSTVLPCTHCFVSSNNCPWVFWFVRMDSDLRAHWRCSGLCLQRGSGCCRRDTFFQLPVDTSAWTPPSASHPVCPRLSWLLSPSQPIIVPLLVFWVSVNSTLPSWGPRPDTQEPSLIHPCHLLWIELCPCKCLCWSPKPQCECIWG